MRHIQVSNRKKQAAGEIGQRFNKDEVPPVDADRRCQQEALLQRVLES